MKKYIILLESYQFKGSLVIISPWSSRVTIASGSLRVSQISTDHCPINIATISPLTPVNVDLIWSNIYAKIS